MTEKLTLEELKTIEEQAKRQAKRLRGDSEWSTTANKKKWAEEAAEAERVAEAARQGILQKLRGV